MGQRHHGVRSRDSDRRPGVPRRSRLHDRLRDRTSSQLVTVVLLEPIDERVHVAFDGEYLTESHAVDEWEGRLLEQGPALAQEWIVGLDEHRLDRRACALCDQREAALE